MKPGPTKGLLRFLPLAASAFLGVSAAGSARAQGFDAERFVPAAGVASELTVESPVVPYHLGLGVGLFLNFADDPVVEIDEATGDDISKPLDHSLGADLVASVGLWNRFELGLHLPVHLVQNGDEYLVGGATLSGTAGIGDLRVVPKATLLASGDAHTHFLLGLALPLSTPTGDEAALRGSGGLGIEPRLLFLAQLGDLAIGGNLGYVWRSEKPAALPVGNELRFALSLAYDLTPDQLKLHAEILGGKQLATEVSGSDFPMEALAGVAYHLDDHWKLYGVGGPGLLDGLGSPDFRVLAGLRYGSDTPRRNGFADSDGDGIIDREDECRKEPEDEDGFKDDDGCPEADNDYDGVLDEVDECPDLPEERGGDGDGCPSRTLVKVEDGEIQVIGKLQFETGSDRVSRKSDALLDQISVALQAHPELENVRIEGHTDNDGDEKLNMQLSKSRAKSVKKALVERGVSGSRLETEGYGESRPRAPNKTRAGRAKNRRVEFKIAD